MSASLALPLLALAAEADELLCVDAGSEVLQVLNDVELVGEWTDAVVLGERG